MDIYKIIQSAVQNTVSNMKLTEYKIGTVVGTEPLKIKFDESKIIEDMGENIIYTEQVLEKKLNIVHNHLISCLSHRHDAVGLSHTHTSGSGSTGASLSGSYETTASLSGSYHTEPELTVLITINEGIKMDDKLLMLRVGGGQRFIIVSKLRSKKSVIINKDGDFQWQ